MARQPKLTADRVVQGVEEYFAACDKAKAILIAGKTPLEVRKPYTIEGLVVYMGITRETLRRWCDGEHGQDVTPAKIEAATTPEERARLTGLCEDNMREYGTHTPVRDALSGARARIAEDMSERALLNTYNPKIACLLLSGLGYSDPTATTNVNLKVEWAGVTPDKMQDYSG